MVKKKETQRFRKACGLFLAALVFLTEVLSVRLPAQAASGLGTVAVSVERFTIGQEYLIEPCLMEIRQGDTYADICARVLEENNYTYTTSGAGFYLSGINGADKGEILIPSCIRSMPQIENAGGEMVSPPANDAVNEYAGDEKWLGEFSYNNMSGWMYSVNNSFPGVGMDGYTPQDGDVFRLQFSVFGYGADLSGMGQDGKLYYQVGDKTALMAKVAQMNQNKEAWFALEGCEAAYKEALRQLKKVNAYQKDIDRALERIPMLPVYPESVALEPSSLALTAGDTAGLSAVFSPADANRTDLTWESSAPDIVSVDQSGNLSASAAGEADITATTENGLTAVCHVTVEDLYVTKIRLNYASRSMEKGGSFKLAVDSYEPSNATESLYLLYESSDEEVAGVEAAEDGAATVTARAAGEADIRVSTSRGVSASCHVTVDDPEGLAGAMEEKIKKLLTDTEVTEDNAYDVMVLWEEYSSLSEKAKGLISEDAKAGLEKAADTAREILGSMAELAAKAAEVERMLNALPGMSKVSLKDAAAVEAARSAYDALPEEGKEKVDPDLYTRLENLERAIADLQAEAEKVKALIHVDLSKRADISSDDVKNAAVALELYDGMGREERDSLPEGVEKAAEDVRAWLIKAAHESNGFTVDADWFVALCADLVSDEKAEQYAGLVREEYTKDSVILKVAAVSFRDLRSGENFVPGKALKVTADLSGFQAARPLVLAVSQSTSARDVTLEKLEAEYDQESQTMSFWVEEGGIYLLADVPVSVTAIRVPATATVGIGSTVELSVTYIPADATVGREITYTSSDPAVVEVSADGVLTGKAPGTVTVTVASVSNPALNAVCRVTVTDKANTLEESVEQVMREVSAYMLSIDKSPALGSEWFVLGLARSGKDLNDSYFTTYYNHIANYLKEHKGKLTNTARYTEYSKMILVMTAIGKDPRNVAGYNLFDNLADFDDVKKQGFNGPIWALLALNSKDEYSFPSVSGVSNPTTEEKLIQYILDGECEGGGFALSGTKADPDITGMALQALAPYCNKSGREDVTAAIGRAVDALSAMQNNTGGFSTMNVETSESCAQVLTALSALGIDPQTDARFIKNGNWIVENLISYHVKHTGFMHVKKGAGNNGGGEAGKVNGMATEQGYYALTAYQRMKEKKTSLYDMSDLNVSPGGNGDGSGTGLKDPDKNNGDGNKNNQKPTAQSKQVTTATTKKTTQTSGTAKSATASSAAKSSKSTASAKSLSSGTKKASGWSFDGEDYVPGAVYDTDGAAGLAVEDAGIPEASGGKPSVLELILNGQNTPYFLCVGNGLLVLYLCLWMNRKNKTEAPLAAASPDMGQTETDEQ